ncbi:peptidoglycan DD-metalloendopeptidase family protein [Arthrobacter sp. UM1]|uniref:peptidoglycan DD-metalloendopeptidase family protein n=1 Tax=Arthrobacter sp. UM1 TaxID=2766776 RepID=UPI00299EDF11|nr:peptidoglycan DD-metalloendopeptidase family protein [Arthrobacter sp. UM1]MCB4209157.1 peptidoglycan DD-metalloendopeptidase family protein [Arthrobacter sp. UM1]
MSTDVYPVPDELARTISQRFGEDPHGRRFPWNRHTGGHLGQDYPCPVGTPVRAIADGTVLWADWGHKITDDELERKAVLPDNSSEEGGFCVYIDHGDWISCYAHLSHRYPAAGERVTRGQVIGLSGNTGQSTGPHLHFECILEARVDLAPGKVAGILWARYDPQLQIDAENKAAALAAARAAARPVTPRHAIAPAGLFWIVDPGDTLGGIAAHYGKTIAELAQHNGIRHPDRIEVGQRILIPGAVVHTVTAADVASPQGVAAAIGGQYGLSGEHIMHLNGWTVSTIVYAGNRAWVQKG